MRKVSNPLVMVRGQLASEACVFFTMDFCALGAFGRSWAQPGSQTMRQIRVSLNNNAQTSTFLEHIDLHATGFPPAVTSHEHSSDIPRPHPRKSDSRRCL